jgi:hypothetical protein
VITVNFREAIEHVYSLKTRVFNIGDEGYVEGSGLRIRLDGKAPFVGVFSAQAIWTAERFAGVPETTRIGDTLRLSLNEEKMQMEMQLKILPLDEEIEEPEYFATVDMDKLQQAYERLASMLESNDRRLYFQNRFGRLFMVGHNEMRRCTGAEAIGMGSLEAGTQATTVAKVLSTYTRTPKIYAGISKRRIWFSDGSDISVYGPGYEIHIPEWDVLVEENALAIAEVDSGELMKALMVGEKISHFAKLSLQNGSVKVEIEAKDKMEATIHGSGTGEESIGVRIIPLAYILRGQKKISLEIIMEDVLVVRGYNNYYFFASCRT